ncbi:MAG: hypothetical protein ACM3UL_02970, partial [Ignavibacteria bacterium]
IATVIIALIIMSLFLALSSLKNQTAARPFYIGVEYAYGNNLTAELQLAQIEALLNKVKDYTNLFVIGDLSLTFNQTNLTRACDTIYNHSKLDFIVLFTGGDKYSYNIAQWMFEANDRYGSRFLGIYKYDEPGGNQLDNTSSQYINKTVIEASASYADIARAYVGNLTFMVNFYQEHGKVNVSTSDYGLYWFDYQSHYNTIYAEFVGNESRDRIIALDRGAAQAFGKDWGVIINWKYNQDPFLENGTELYNDLELAYSAGARYAFVFSYSPNPIGSQYGILKEEHFEALRKFWNNLHTNPASFNLNKAEAAYIVPRNYGFGFRSPTDTIWGLKPADELSAKIFEDTNNALPRKYGSRFDVLYDEPEIIATMLGNYTKVYYWNQTIP